MKEGRQTAVNDAESTLASVGSFGAVQWFLAIVLWVLVGPFTIFVEVNQILLLLTPDHWCSVPEVAAYKLSRYEARRISIPSEGSEGRFSGCAMYDVNFTQLLLASDRPLDPDPSWPTKQCSHGWEYDHHTVYRTLVEEWNWVCGEAWKPYFAHTIFWLGSVIGVVFWGAVSDRFGRVLVIVLCHVLATLSGICTHFVWDFYSLLACRFLVGFVFFTQSLSFLVLALEFVGKNRRLLISTGYLAGCYAAFVLIPLAAYYVPFLRDWRVFNLAASVPPVSVALLARWYPESVRWLVSTGQHDRARTTLQWIARVNRVDLPEGHFNETKLFQMDCSRNSASVMDVLRKRNLRRAFALVLAIWLILSLCYNGQLLYAANLSSNPFFMIALISAVDIVGNMVAGKVAGKFGRRPPIVVNCLAAAVMYVAAAAVPEGSQVLDAVASLCGRLVLAIGYSVQRLYAAEVFPTVVRSQVISVQQALGSLGRLISPQVVYLSLYSRSLPPVVFGATCAVASFLMTGLPETLNKTLPDTIDEAEALTRDDPGAIADCARNAVCLFRRCPRKGDHGRSHEGEEGETQMQNLALS